MKRKSISTLIIILAVIVIAVWAINRPIPQTTEEIAECIGQNGVLYVQLGCHACNLQEDYFGEYHVLLNKVDCIFNKQACIDKNISATPTWEIDGTFYSGAKSIEKLKDLTGC